MGVHMGQLLLSSLLPITHKVIRSLLVAKSSTYDAIGNATKTIMNVVNESQNHRAFCAKWGITEQELDSTPESPATTAYGAYIMDVGLQGVSPYLLGSGRVSQY